MLILERIKNDAALLRGLFANPQVINGPLMNRGVALSGKYLEDHLDNYGHLYANELERLELIIETGIIPPVYYSLVNEQNYYSTESELKNNTALLKPAAHTFFALKHSRKKNSGLKNSRFTVLADDFHPVLSFFIENNPKKEYPCGGFSLKVKKGFIEDSGVAPKYAVKVYRDNKFGGNDINRMRAAMRAAYCYQQLGYTGVSFRTNKKQYLVTDWLKGVNLEEADQAKVQSIPIPQRIVMAIALIKELNILHKLGLIHGDIKPGNVMINYDQLGFVDLDSVRRKNERPKHDLIPMYTSRFVPPAFMRCKSEDLYKQFNEQSDIYALGLTLVYLFQEIFVPEPMDNNVKIDADGVFRIRKVKSFRLYEQKQSEQHPGLRDLLRRMILQTSETPLTTEKLLLDIKQILSSYPGYEKFLALERPVGLKVDYKPEMSAQAFKNIEIELLGYHQRVDDVTRVFGR